MRTWATWEWDGPGQWVCLLLCFFMLSQPLTPGRAQEADDGLSDDDAAFADDGLSDEDDPSLAALAGTDVEDCVPVGEDELIELNFEGADIREVIQGLAAGLCIHYSIDPQGAGRGHPADGQQNSRPGPLPAVPPDPAHSTASPRSRSATSTILPRWARPRPRCPC